MVSSWRAPSRFVGRASAAAEPAPGSGRGTRTEETEMEKFAIGRAIGGLILASLVVIASSAFAQLSGQEIHIGVGAPLTTVAASSWGRSSFNAIGRVGAAIIAPWSI